MERTAIIIIKVLSHLLIYFFMVTRQVFRGFIKYGFKYQIN